jgi:membrane associated rhomboid family serine protease
MVLLLIIIVSTSLVTIYAFSNPSLFDRLKFNAYVIKHENQWWRFLSYGALHAGWGHLLINMFVLFSFGRTVIEGYEILFGTKGFLYFILLYIGGIVFSILLDYGKHRDDPYYNAVGASGAVSAVLFANIILFPSGSLYLFPIPFPIPSIIFGILYLVYSAYMARRAKDNIGHNAHFWGAVYGIVLTLALKPKLALLFWEQIRNIF